MKHATSEG